jgi:hypothetical protein
MVVNCEQKYLRLLIRDELDTTKIQMIENVKTNTIPELLPAAKFVSGGPRDLSKVPGRCPETCPVDLNLS